MFNIVGNYHLVKYNTLIGYLIENSSLKITVFWRFVPQDKQDAILHLIVFAGCGPSRIESFNCSHSKSKAEQKSDNLQYNILVMARILPTGLLPKTTQNYKPLRVPNPKIPIEFTDKPNPTHTRGFFWVIPLGTHGYPP